MTFSKRKEASDWIIIQVIFSSNLEENERVIAVTWINESSTPFMSFKHMFNDTTERLKSSFVLFVFSLKTAVPKRLMFIWRRENGRAKLRIMIIIINIIYLHFQKTNFVFFAWIWFNFCVYCMIFIVVDLSALSSLTQESAQLICSNLYIQHVDSFRIIQMSLLYFWSK